jgi:hypothetical protein
VADGRDIKDRQAPGASSDDSSALSGVTDGGIVAKYPPRGPSLQPLHSSRASDLRERR